MIKIPASNRQFSQPNNSDLLGNIFATFNCDFDSNVGAIRLSKRMILNTATADVTDMTGFSVGFKTFDNGTGSKIYTVAGSTATPGFVFQGGSDPTGTFSKLTGTPTGFDSAYSDLEVFNNELYATPDSATAKYLDVSNTWHDLATGSTSNAFARPLCVFPALQRIYQAIDGYKVISSDTSHVVASIGAANTVSIDVAIGRQAITFIKSSSNRLWVGTVNLLGGKGFVYEWDGVSTQYNKSYQMDCAGALSCVIKNDVPWITDSNGVVSKWNGGTFQKVTAFNRKVSKQLYNLSTKQNLRFVHPNGMTIIDGMIHINVHLMNNDGTSDTTGNSINGSQEFCNPSGIWVLDETTNTLKHKYSYGLSKSGGTVTDFGQFRLYGVGGIAELVTNKDSQINTYNGQLLAGCSYYTDATTKTSGIFYDDTNDTLAKAGYSITPKIYSSEVLDTWVRAYLRHKKFLSGSDKMVVKYRFVDDVPMETTITWLTTTSFSYPDSATLYVKGDEVEVTKGLGSGKCSRITDIQHGSGVYIVTTAETFTGATGTSIARFMKWVEAGTIQDVKDVDSVNFGKGFNSTWIQLKVWMSWTGANELNDVLLVNKKFKSE